MNPPVKENIGNTEEIPIRVEKEVPREEIKHKSIFELFKSLFSFRISSEKQITNS